MHVLMPDVVLPDYKRFTTRYCDGHVDRFGHWNTQGKSCVDELRSLLIPYMVRRLKRDVLEDLPPKERRVVKIQLDKSVKERFDEYRKQMKDLQISSQKCKDNVAKCQRILNEMKLLKMRMWRETGELKIPGVKAWLQEHVSPKKRSRAGHLEKWIV